ncbi:ankyrin repeat protein [Planoprotostelium fungivorum]|uniref:Ankyrin repeat protein n=1 Tax=Planoprotostelium fungivorum TaxID=1890364 RepID=A0A2P6NL84_9EUKA|nr:ankyrin repeat protein [Planoprotostelium fungivorum]
MNDVVQAIKKNDLDKIQSLVEQRGASILDQASKKGDFPIHVAVEEQNTDILNYLLEKNVNTNAIDKKTGQTALGLAATINDQQAVETLSDYHKTDMNIADKQGYTPLHRATQGDFEEISLLLIGHAKANLTLTTEEGRTALHYAVATNNMNTVSALLSKNVNVNAQDKEGRSAVFIAVSSGSLPLTKLLIEKSKQKVDLDLQDTDGDTVLHTAYTEEIGHKGIVEYLETKGVNGGIVNKRGQTPKEKTPIKTSKSSQGNTKQKKQQNAEPKKEEKDAFGVFLVSQGLADFDQELRKLKVDMENFENTTEAMFRKAGVASDQISYCMDVVNAYRTQKRKKVQKSIGKGKGAVGSTTSQDKWYYIAAAVLALLLLVYFSVQSGSSPSNKYKR